MARPPTIIKKYGNRRLYDTGDSRYVTLEELAAKVQGGVDVQVVDAKTGEDLTQVTLTQMIIEGRQLARLLPVRLLTQLIRLGDDALAEFFGRYVTGALEVYLSARRGADALSPYNPFAQLPFAAGDALARLWMASPLGGRGAPPPPAAEPPPHDIGPDTGAGRAERDDLADLRRELEELKRAVRDQTPPPARRGRRKPTS